MVQRFRRYWQLRVDYALRGIGSLREHILVVGSHLVGRRILPKLNEENISQRIIIIPSVEFDAALP